MNSFDRDALDVCGSGGLAGEVIHGTGSKKGVVTSTCVLGRRFGGARECGMGVIRTFSGWIGKVWDMMVGVWSSRFG